MNLVTERILHWFTMDTHTRCWKHYAVRPAPGSGEPEVTDDRYCQWDRLAKGYGFTNAWVNKLVRELSDEHNYQAFVGYSPVPREQPKMRLNGIVGKPSRTWSRR